MATTAARYWLVKSEPNKYSWQAFAREKKTVWDGVRNFEARNNLRAMKQGDLVLFYHSNEGKEIVGVAKVSREAYPDPTAAGEDWSVVELVPVKALTRAVTLAEIKSDAQFKDMALVRRSRISVVPVTPAELKHVLALAQTKL